MNYEEFKDYIENLVSDKIINILIEYKDKFNLDATETDSLYYSNYDYFGNLASQLALENLKRF